MLKKSCIFLPRSVKEPSSERKRGVEVRDPFCEKKGSCSNISSFVSLIDDLRDG